MIDSLGLEAEQKIFLRTELWLKTLVDNIPKSYYPSDAELLQLYLGYQICRVIRNQSLGAIDKTTLLLKQDMDRRTDDIIATTCDPLLALLVSSIMKHQKLSSPRLDKFAQEVAAAIQSEISADEDCVDLFSARYLLAKLGLLKSIKRTSLLDRSVDFWVAGNESLMRSVAAEVTASTVFGTETPSNLDATCTLQVAFSGWTLHALYEYNLELGAFLARVLNYLAPRDSRTLNEIYQFLLFQQQPDGRFGYLADQANKLKSSKFVFNEDYKLYLPVTVSCLWTLSEMRDKKFRVFAL